METVDLRKELKHLYTPSPKEPSLVDVPAFTFAMIDGEGNPNTSQSFHDAIQALFAITYTAKFHRREDKAVDYKAMPLEGLWWTEDGSPISIGSYTGLRWTMMIAQPPTFSQSLFDEIRDKAMKKAPMVENARVETFAEGRCAQVMHVGPYSDEAPTIARLLAFVAAQGLELRGRHHEIYLGDPRRGDQSRLKTILRQPVG
jgi:hypothetical protein